MSENIFRPLKDFHLYEVSPNGDVRKRTTKRPLTPMQTKSGERFALYDSGHCLTISRSKLRHCYRNGTSPYELRGKVISNGELTDIASHCNRLKLMNEEIHRLSKADADDLITQYERGERFLSLMIKMLRKELSEEEGEELQEMVRSCIRKGLVRYYRDKKEYRKEEIDDIAKEVFYGTFLSHCPLNIDCYVYEIVKRKLGNKK